MALADCEISITTVMDRIKLLEFLRNCAKEKGVTFSALAKTSGVAREHFYGMLSKKGNPRLATLLKVVEALNIEIQITAR